MSAGDLWTCWYCGSLNPGKDKAGVSTTTCVHCNAPRKVDRKIEKEPEEGRYFWHENPNRMSVTCSYLSPSASWTYNIHKNELIDLTPFERQNYLWRYAR